MPEKDYHLRKMLNASPLIYIEENRTVLPNKQLVDQNTNVTAMFVSVDVETNNHMISTDPQ